MLHVPVKGSLARRHREAGENTVGEIVDFESTFLLCCARGPAGLIVELTVVGSTTRRAERPGFTNCHVHC